MMDLLNEVKNAISETVIYMNNSAKEDLENNIHKGLQYDGSAVKPLSQSWIKRKGHSIPFLWKGLLSKSARDIKTVKGYEIYISGDRSAIAGRLQKDRPFFGFTRAKGEKIINNSIKKGFNKF